MPWLCSAAQRTLTTTVNRTQTPASAAITETRDCRPQRCVCVCVCLYAMLLLLYAMLCYAMLCYVMPGQMERVCDCHDIEGNGTKNLGATALAQRCPCTGRETAIADDAIIIMLYYVILCCRALLVMPIL